MRHTTIFAFGLGLCISGAAQLTVAEEPTLLNCGDNDIVEAIAEKRFTKGGPANRDTARAAAAMCTASVPPQHSEANLASKVKCPDNCKKLTVRQPDPNLTGGKCTVDGCSSGVPDGDGYEADNSKWIEDCITAGGVNTPATIDKDALKAECEAAATARTGGPFGGAAIYQLCTAKRSSGERLSIANCSVPSVPVRVNVSGTVATAGSGQLSSSFEHTGAVNEYINSLNSAELQEILETLGER